MAILTVLSGVCINIVPNVGIGVTAVRPAPTGLESGDLVIMSAFASDPRDSRTMLLNSGTG